VTFEKWKTVREWALLHGYSGMTTGGPNGIPEGDKTPADYLSWYEVVIWCNARSEMEGFTPVYYTDNTLTKAVRWGQSDLHNDAVNWNADGYRLPTEAEWEFAARGGTRSKNFLYSGSNTPAEVAWFNVNSSHVTHDVGKLFPNELGLYDMSGNVFEWCWDWNGPYIPGQQTDPKGASSGDARVLRGGSNNFGLLSCTNSARHADPPMATNFAGFRCVSR
jgi:formylglycine-generating enzyme